MRTVTTLLKTPQSHAPNFPVVTYKVIKSSKENNPNTMLSSSNTNNQREKTKTPNKHVHQGQESSTSTCLTNYSVWAKHHNTSAIRNVSPLENL